MEARLFSYARELFATAQLDWTAGDVRAVLLPPEVALDGSEQFLSEIASGARIAISEIIGNRTAANGVCNGDPAEFPSLADTRLVQSVVLFKDTGSESSSLLIAYYGDENIQGDPFAPAGVDYFFYPDATLGGYFVL